MQLPLANIRLQLSCTRKLQINARSRRSSLPEKRCLRGVACTVLAPPAAACPTQEVPKAL